MNGETLFIADLHLDSREPSSLKVFTKFINERARGIDHLYILGDLFEVWIGDDDDDPVNSQICMLLRDCVSSGTAISVQAGNRDFLMGESFAAKTGCTLLAEVEAVDLFGTRILLLHGDQLCTNDTEYQQFREMIRAPGWRKDFLARPIEERRSIARGLRDASTQNTLAKPADKMQIHTPTLEAMLNDHRCSTVIHGHTHIPGDHRFDSADGKTRHQRLVVGAWGRTAHICVASAEGLSLQIYDPSTLST